MSDSLEKKIGTAKQLAHSCEITAALAVADEILAEAPEEMRAWMLRAYVHELAANYASARADLSHAIEHQAPDPYLLYTRGRMAYLLQDFQAALEDFTEALRLEQLHQSDYYDQEIYFWRAATLVSLENLKAARQDLAHVNDGFCTWTDGLLSKADLLVLCG